MKIIEEEWLRSVLTKNIGENGFSPSYGSSANQFSQFIRYLDSCDTMINNLINKLHPTDDEIKKLVDEGDRLRNLLESDKSSGARALAATVLHVNDFISNLKHKSNDQVENFQDMVNSTLEKSLKREFGRSYVEVNKSAQPIIRPPLPAQNETTFRKIKDKLSSMRKKSLMQEPKQNDGSGPGPGPKE